MNKKFFSNMHQQMTPKESTVKELKYKISTLEEIPNQSKKKTIIRTTTAIAACLVVALTITVLTNSINNGFGTMPSESGLIITLPETEENKPSIATEIAPEPNPDIPMDMPLDLNSLAPNQKYDTVSYNGLNYSATKGVVDKDKLGEKLTTADVNGVAYAHIAGINHTYKDAEIYSINSIKTNAFIAIYMSENEQSSYYIFENNNYIPTTLGEYLDDFYYLDNIQFADIIKFTHDQYNSDTASHAIYYTKDKTYLTDFLNAFKDSKITGFNRNILNVDSWNSVGIDSLSINNVDFAFTSEKVNIQVYGNGYLVLQTSAASEFCFEIGTEKANEFINYCTENLADPDLNANDIQSSDTSTDNIDTPPAFDNKYSYSSTIYNNNTYSTTYYTIDKAKIESKLGTSDFESSILQTNDLYPLKDVEIYKISNVSANAFIAAMITDESGESAYFVFRNDDYRPKTLSDLINDFNLKENLQFNTLAEYNPVSESGISNTTYYTLKQNPPLWDLLMSKTNAKFILSEDISDKSQSDFMQLMTISVDMPIGNIINCAMGVTQNGYLFTNITQYGSYFYIGEENAQKFVDYILENNEGISTPAYSEGEVPETEIAILE